MPQLGRLSQAAYLWCKSKVSHDPDRRHVLGNIHFRSWACVHTFRAGQQKNVEWYNKPTQATNSAGYSEYSDETWEGVTEEVLRKMLTQEAEDSQCYLRIPYKYIEFFLTLAVVALFLLQSNESQILLLFLVPLLVYLVNHLRGDYRVVRGES